MRVRKQQATLKNLEVGSWKQEVWRGEEIGDESRVGGEGASFTSTLSLKVYLNSEEEGQADASRK
jgi:hypothetical protein